MIIYFADRQLNILGHAGTNLPRGQDLKDDCKSGDIETGVEIFECKVPFTKSTRKAVESYTEVGNYILRYADGESKLFQITESECDTKKQVVYVYAEDDGMDLLNEVVGPYEADKAYPISHYINKYAAGAGFVIGINEVENLTRKLIWDGESTATERIASIAAQFDGCEISFSFEVSGLYITKKYINIYKERGQNVGVTLRLNDDIDSITTTKSMTIALSANTTLGIVGSYTQIPLDKNVLSTSERLTLVDNSIRIGSNIQYVKVSGQTLIKCGTTAGNRHARIQKVSGSTTTSVAWSCVYGTTASNTVYCMTPVIISVTEGDLLKMVFYTSDAADMNASGSAANGWQTYLTVEEL